jgi:hypothetical protein
MCVGVGFFGRILSDATSIMPATKLAVKEAKTSGVALTA